MHHGLNRRKQLGTSDCVDACRKAEESFSSTKSEPERLWTDQSLFCDFPFADRERKSAIALHERLPKIVSWCLRTSVPSQKWAPSSESKTPSPCERSERGKERKQTTYSKKKRETVVLTAFFVRAWIFCTPHLRKKQETPEIIFTPLQQENKEREMFDADLHLRTAVTFAMCCCFPYSILESPLFFCGRVFLF